jgi:hypothetical protein
MIKNTYILAAIFIAMMNCNVQGYEGYGHVTGTRKILVIRVQCSDLSNAITYDQVVSVMSAFRTRTQQSSYNRLDVTYDITPTIYTLPYPSAHYSVSPGNNDDQRAELLRVDSINLAHAAGYHVTPDDYMSYDRVLLFLPKLKLSWPLQQKGAAMVNGTVPTATLHEMGHTWFFDHSGLWQVSDGNPISPTGHQSIYGDYFDIMGNTYSPYYNNLDYNMYHKFSVGWIDASQIFVSNSPGTYTYTISRFDNVAATGPLVVKVAAGSANDYWIGYRRGFLGFAAPLGASAHGAYILRVPNAPVPSKLLRDNKTSLLDMQTTGTQVKDAMLPIGATFTDSVNHISITAVAEGGVAPHEWITIKVVRQ